METTTFRAPFSWSSFPYSLASSTVAISTPNSSPSSSKLGFTRKGRQGRAASRASPVVSTTACTPRATRGSRSVAYTSRGREGGTLPASTAMSPGARAASLSASAPTAARGMDGPSPFKSVSGPPGGLTFTLMRVCPWGRKRKSAGQPRSSKRRATSCPENPAAMAKARVCAPREARSRDTLMPLPPGAQVYFA